MKANHVPRKVRLENRIKSLQQQLDEAHVKSRNRGNPYWMCRHCEIHDPQLSIDKGRHFKGCPLQGVDKAIAYFKQLLNEELVLV